MKKASKNGEWMKVRACGNRYGWRFVIDAVEQAAQLKEAEEMQMEQIEYLRRNKQAGEARILTKAKELGVKLYG